MQQNKKIVFWNSKSPIFVGVFIGQIIGTGAAYMFHVPLIAGSSILGIAAGLIGFAITKRKTL